MVCGQERNATLAQIKSGFVMVCAAFLVALVLASAVTADVWDDYDYPGQKRKLKVWIRGAGGIPGFAAAVQAAIDNWNGTSGNPPRDNNGAWELVPGGTEADHDVDIGGTKMDGAGGTLGDTGFTDANGDGVAEGGSDINIDNQENWGPGANQQDLERTIKHELGHAQRMDDTAIAGDLMNGGQAAGNHNVTPSGHDQDEARASYWDNMLIDILPERLRKGVPTLCSITGPGMNLWNAASVSIIPVDPSHLQVSNVTWNPTQIRAMFFAMPPSMTSQGAWHNEGFSIDVHYMDNSTATFGSFVTATDTDPTPGRLPHANAGPDVVSWIGHTFTLHGCGSYHDDPAYTDSLVHVWKWATQPGLTGGGAQTEMLSRAINQPGTYTFALEVEDTFTQKSTDTVTVTVEPYPPAGTDCFASTANIALTDPSGIPHILTLSGPVSVRRSAAWDDLGLLTIDTEIVSMSLTVFDPVLGEVKIALYPPNPCLGRVKMPSPGVYYPAESFFDVFCEITIGNNPPLHNSTADHLIAPDGINGIPFPDGTQHRSTAIAPIPLLNQGGSPSGWSFTGLKTFVGAASSPDGYTDCMDTRAVIVVRDTSTGASNTLDMSGPLAQKFLNAGGSGTDFDAIECVDYIIATRNPVGGEARAVLSSNHSSTGVLDKLDPPNNFPLQSFFDVFFEITLPGTSASLHNCAPLPMMGTINALPTPPGTIYDMAPGPVALLDSTGNPTNYVIDSFQIITGPTPGSYQIMESYTVTGSLTYDDPASGPSTSQLDGTIVIRRNPPGPDPGPIPIEIVELSLQSIQPITLTYVGTNPNRVSTGNLLPSGSGIQWPVDSFFDVFTELALPDGKTLKSCGPVYLRSDSPVSGLPFAPGTTFSKAWLSLPVTTYHDGLPYGSIQDMHLTVTNGEVLEAGCSLFTTPAGGATRRDFGMDPIPADFFAPGSDPFHGIVVFQGEPLATTPPGILGLTDTIVERNAPVSFPGCGGTVTVPIEIVALSLVSCQPITVTYPSGPPEIWDVRVSLPSQPQPTGSMTVTKTHCNGGTWSSTLPVQARFTFTRLDDPSIMRILDTGPIDYSWSGSWLDHDPGFGWVTAPPGFELDGMPIICTNFYPGIEDPGCGSGYTLRSTEMRAVGAAQRVIASLQPPQSDADDDYYPDVTDNCPFAPNPLQEDADGDGIGDQCDNCPSTPNPCQEDSDNDGIGDHCDPVLSPAEAKQGPVGRYIILDGPVVSSFFDVFFYVQTPLVHPPDPGRPGLSGIRINDWGAWRPPFLNLGDRVSVTGTLRVADGEAVIDASSVQGHVGPPDLPPNPIFMAMPNLGGAPFGVQPAVGRGVGLNNVGLLGRAAGWVVDFDPVAKIGTLATARTGYLPGDSVKIDFSRNPGPINLPWVGDFIVVTGAISGKGTPGGGDIEPRLHVISIQ